MNMQNKGAGPGWVS